MIATTLVIAGLVIVGGAAFWGTMRHDNRRDDERYAPAPFRNYTLPPARVSRAAPQTPPGGRHGASPDDEIDQWLAELHHDDGAGFLTAPPPPDVPGRGVPAAPTPGAAQGRRAPASTVAETARPAGDPGPPSSHPETWTHWHTQLIPPAQHQAAKTAALDYMPRVPFRNWESDTFVEGLTAIKDGD